MPVYNLTSAKSGRTYKVHADSEPTEADIDEAVANFDAPFERVAQASQLENLIGGRIIDPVTNQPAYAAEQRVQDERAVGLYNLARQQGQLQREAQNLERIADTGMLESAAAGAASIPAAIPNILDLAATKMGARMPGEWTGTLEALNQELSGRQSANPLSAAVGAAAANVASMGGAGGALTTAGRGALALRAGETALGKQLLSEAGKQSALNIPINVGIGTGIRSVAGQDTTLNDLILDASLAVVGGSKKPIKTIGQAEKLGEEVVLKEIKKELSEADILPEDIAPIPINVPGARVPFETTADKLSNIGIVRGINKGSAIIGELGKSVGRMAKSAVTVASLEDDALTALNPRARAIDPKKQVLAQANAKKAWENASGYIPEMYERGHSLESAVKTADMMAAIKDRAFSRRSEMSGQPIEVSLDPMADAIDAIARDEVVALQLAEKVPELVDMAKLYRGKTVPANVAERLNRYFNAETEVVLAGMTGSDRAAKLTADPILRAYKAASGALKGSLNDSLGGEFSEMGKLYGAAAEIEGHALVQAVKQHRLENAPGLAETLAASGMGSSSPWGAMFSVAQAKAVKMAGSPDAKFAALNARVLKELERRGIKVGERVEEAVESVAPPVTAAPVAAPVVPSAPSPVDLEAAIQETIRLLPREMRGAQERAIAEAIVLSRQAP